jgi:F420-dependent oxidoreductase-like protein
VTGDGAAVGDPGPVLQLGVGFDYQEPVRAQLADGRALEDAGADAIWVPEAWGYDAPSLLGYLAASTERVRLCSGVLPVYTRSAALIAQTAAALGVISDGRFELGLGTSGPQVIEGFHGIPFVAPLDRMRDTIAVCRALWAGENSRCHGASIRIPARDGTGLGKPLRLLAPEPIGPVPIHLAVMRPAMVELAAELADGWYPLMYTPDGVDRVWGPALRRGAARRAADRGRLDVTVEYTCAVGPADRVEYARAAARGRLARYIGGMGARRANFYTEVAAALGWPDEADRIQRLYLDGRRAAAAAAIPATMLDALTLIGDRDEVAQRLCELRESGVTTVIAHPADGDRVGLVRTLRPIFDEVVGS